MLKTSQVFSNLLARTTREGAHAVSRAGRVTGDRVRAAGSVSRSPRSQLFELRVGPGGPTPCGGADAAPGVTRPLSLDLRAVTSSGATGPASLEEGP
jgi:hypothetical protein